MKTLRECLKLQLLDLLSLSITEALKSASGPTEVNGSFNPVSGKHMVR